MITGSPTGEDGEMKHVGDEQEGFTVAFDATTGTLHVVAWGFWGPRVAAEFAGAIGDASSKLARGRVAFDMTRLKPMRDEGQAAWRLVVQTLTKHAGITRVSIATSSHLTKLQLLRVAKLAAGAYIEKLEWVEQMLA
jgi:hypothetical protein